MEEVYMYDGEFLLQDGDKIFDVVENNDGEYSARAYSKIFDTNIRVSINYRFDFDKLLSLFKEYEEKYSVIEGEGSNVTWRNYDSESNGGVYGVEYHGLSTCQKYHEELKNEDGTITSKLFISVKGKDRWVCAPVFEVFFFKYVEVGPNVCNYARFTNKESMKVFFDRLRECIVMVDKDSIVEEIEEKEKEIVKIKTDLVTLNEIMKEYGN